MLALWRESDRVAIAGETVPVTFGALDRTAARVAAMLLDGRRDLSEARVAMHIRPGADWIAALFGIWRAGGVAVPLARSHPIPELQYVLRDSGASTLIGDDSQALADLAGATGATFVATSAISRANASAAATGLAIDEVRRALILYTSGTTGRPKGVVTTHANLDAQVRSLLTAWQWTPADRALLVLPLHHVHGIVNVVLSATTCGASLEMPDRFDAVATWERLASGEISVFTAVPTIYHRLIGAWDAAAPEVQARWSRHVRHVRLMMSGSAALPVAVLARWRDLTGQTLLERYGMTEIGMGLANPLAGERRAGFVGVPLPGVDARIVDETAEPVSDGTSGELEIRGPGVFHEYWHRPDETRDAFRAGWFRTGDVAVIESGSYRLLGRSSVDIIKTGGFKVSALEVEDALREHPAIADCAVVGLPDAEWGEEVSVALELAPSALLALDALRAWAQDRLAPYKIPRRLVCVDALPRNAMGKVLKGEVAGLFSR